MPAPKLKNMMENYGNYSTRYKTELSPEQETGFRQWVEQNNIPFRDSVNNDYDMRGFYQSGKVPVINQQDQLPHFTDQFKTPSHQTFSNESQYATPDAPHWDNNLLKSPTGEVKKFELGKELLDPRIEALKRLKM